MPQRRPPARAFKFYLWKALRDKGISKRRLARMTGMPYPQIIRLSKPDANPQWETVVKLADALEVDPGEFYFLRWLPPPAATST